MLTIAWDVDDVLNSLTREWLEWWRSTAAADAVPDYAALVENPPGALLGLAPDEYLASLDAFRLSERGRSLPPDPKVLEWFERYGARCRHIALTSTPLSYAPYSAEWVMRYFGRWIRSYNLVPSPRRGVDAPEYDATKAGLLAHFGPVDILVDDSPANLRDAEATGVRVVAYPQPWNSADDPDSVLVSLTRMIESSGLGASEE